MEQLNGKVAIVTGGGSGIGRSISLGLAAEGVAVAVADLSSDAANAVAAAIIEKGGRAIGIGCDVVDRDATFAMVAQTANELGSPAILCANAGVATFTPLPDVTASEWDWTIDVNLRGVVNCLSAVLPGMIEAGEGHIVATGSMAGLIPDWVPLQVPYSASKAAVIAMVVNMQPELAQRGIGCSVLCPGRVPTSIMNSPSYRTERYGGPRDEKIVPPTEFFERNTATILTRTPDEAAKMVIEGIRTNSLFILTDHTMRPLFDAYVDRVHQGFDAAARFQ